MKGAILLSEKKTIEPGVYTVNPKINVNKKPVAGNLMTIYRLNEMTAEQIDRYNLSNYRKARREHGAETEQ